MLATDRPATSRITGSRTRNVLLVEDAQPDALVICQMIESEADRLFDVTYVGDLASAVACLETTRFDAILLDLNLPDSHGLNTYTAVRRHAAGAPVVVLTASPSEEAAVTALRLGVQDYLPKAMLNPATLVRSLLYAVERQQARWALKQTEARFRAAAESSLDGLFILASVRDEHGDIMDYRFLDLNTLGSAMLGRPRRDVIGRLLRDLLPGAAAELIEKYAVVEETGEPLEEECRLAPAELSAEWVHQQVVRLNDGVAVTVRDVTDGKEAGARHALLVEAVDRLRDAVMISAASDAADAPRVVFVNQAFERLTGRHRGDLLGRPATLFQGPAGSSRGPAARPDPGVTEELVGYTSTGLECWIETEIILVAAADGSPAHVVTIQRDISERKRLEEQLHRARRMEALGSVAGGVAHEFGNLVTGLLGYCDLLDGALDPAGPAAGQLSQIRATAERAADLTRQLLAFSGEDPPRAGILDLSAAVRAAEPALRRIVGNRVTVACQLIGTPATVRMDPRHLEQLLGNLAANARDAMPDGGRLLIEVASADAGEAERRGLDLRAGPVVRLRVTDTGSGIHPDVLPRIFEPFFTTKGPGDGTGLGLAAADAIVRQSGGAITVDSEPAAGTAFAIYLPCEPGAPLPAPVAPRPDGRGKGEAILLVDRDAAVRGSLQQLLQRRGYAVVAAGDADAALRLLGKRRIDLLVTDVAMRPAGGGGLAAEVVRRQPGVRVLFTSAHGADRLTEEGVLDEAATLAKPFTADQLAGRIRELLDAAVGAASG